MAVVYQHVRLDTNQVFYIGIGKTFKRAYATKGRNDYWKSIIKNSNYQIDILFENLTWEEACAKETELIKLYGRKDNDTGILANMTDGGDGVKNAPLHARESSRKRLMGNTYRKGTKNSEETITKIKTARAKQILTEEHKQKISLSLMGRIVSEETRKNIGEKNSIKLKGRKLPKEVCEKMSKSRTGAKHWNYKVNEEQREFIKLNYKQRDKEFGLTPLAKMFNVTPQLIFHILKKN